MVEVVCKQPDVQTDKQKDGVLLLLIKERVKEEGDLRETPREGEGGQVLR